MAKSKATVIAVVSDIHAGGNTAVFPADGVLLDDGQHVAPSKAQSWLWQNWLTLWQTVDDRCKEHDAKLIQVFNGDLVDGTPHQSVQNISANSVVQARVLTECLRIPLALNPSALAIVRGTESHVSKSAASEEKVAEGLRRDKRPIITDPDTGASSHWQLGMEIDGVRLSFAHHGRVGQRSYSKRNIVSLLAFQIWSEHCLRGDLPPHLAIRSHLHTFVDTENQYPTRVIQTPAWQLHTAYAHKVVPEVLSDIGGVIIVIKDGAYTIESVLFKPAAARVWRPES